MRLKPLSLSLAFLAAFGAFAQVPTANKANWKLADRFSTESLRPFVYGTNLTPGWINKTDTFWYSWRYQDGVKFWKVDCKAKKRTPLFDSAHMAALLSQALKKPYDSLNLPITTVTFDEKNDSLMRFTADNVRFEYDLSKDVLKELGRGREGAPPEGGGNFRNRQGRGQGRFGNFGDFHNYSPDKKAYVYAQDHNLFYVEVKDGKDQPPIQLTKDGEKDYSFGSREDIEEQRRQMQQFLDQNQRNQQNQQNQRDQNEKRVHVNATWSKDSKRFFITRTDQRKVADLYLVNSLAEPRPTLIAYKYSMPGEINVPQEEVNVFEPATKTLKKLDVSKWKDQIYFDIHFQDTTSDKLRFVRRDRLQRNLELCEIDLTTNKVTPLLSESIENAFLETQPVKYVKPGGDFIWWSERDGWGHYYLYGNDGKLKHQIDSGPFRSERILDVDADKNVMWVSAVGKEEGEDPYYHHIYRIGLDGKNMTLLDSGDADHNSTLSTDHKYIVDVFSRTDLAPEADLRDENGKPMLVLDKTDLSKLYELGWKMPETFKVKAADGVTDIYGNMWKPFDFDPSKKYPIIANVYPGPQTESVSSTFSALATNQRLAQLGFIVIQIGNRGGNPSRSKAYHSYGYYNLRDYGLADKKAGIEQLAARYPWIDIDRVGIYGHSGGGFMTAAALLLPPYNEFFKVGVSSSGNHDNNVYNQNWSEQHHGLREVLPPTQKPPEDDGDPFGEEVDPVLLDEMGWEDNPVYLESPELLYGFPDDPQRRRGQGQNQDQQGQQNQTNQNNSNQGQFQIHVPTNAELAANLKGNLLLAHGDMDNNVHYAGTVRLMNALMRANKRFEFILIPGKAHGYGDLQPYFTERMMEYFAEHLLGDYRRNEADMTIKP
ncbi:MAG TPA: DPP IV N-terminal domain-containing protein [Fimbriimonadaceae bacterium]|nr:DPP IV N-terminal domain-containing protein [Fimbriimonadaceae bacterium]